MCTYHTETIELDGAGKGGSGWFILNRGAVYVDHPYHACHEHTVNIDFTNPDEGPSARVAVELTEESALALVDAIQKALAAAPPGLASARHRDA
ncbi:DUF6295 family protein [Sphaerisporangium sp. TRM90804]|uniref:DUF6295 family protein n=1 Tax=Sphaerisporangium sp. TRM90804 TaxID=3031113 RepID=UPI00244C9554|nr:DUF6295 family protein [Sphaerisporangium sp. TRM90804]MDH2428911.1 DUF6295 family protein [Sphaerisporangium sp. TRM90804]